MNESALFRSFWLGGFEGADHVNRHGVALDLNHATGHAMQLRGDYRRARTLGLFTVRESIGWRLATAGGRSDFTRAIAMAREARRQQVEIVWSLWHYGFPSDVDPFAPSLPERFESFAHEVARALESEIEPDAWINPVNEISYLVYLLTESGALPPFVDVAPERADALKRNLVHAAVCATRAIRAVMPRARFFHVDPVCHVAAPVGEPALEAEAARYCEALYASWDLLLDPALEPGIASGDRCHAIGLSHYHNSQWEIGSRRVLRWHTRDPRREPLSALLGRVHARYRLPMLIAETSHVGIGRADWLHEIAAECARARSAGLPLEGACIYPLIDRPDWERPAHWHASGVFDVVPRAGARGGRRIAQRAYCHAVMTQTRTLPTTRPPRVTDDGELMDSLVVFSHLRWDSVFQRPQHVMSRLAQRMRVLFVEEPLHVDGPARTELISPVAGLTVMRAHTPVHAGGFHDDQLPTLARLLDETIRRLGLRRYGVWMYTPMALPLLHELSPCMIAYDCMDELAAFRNPPRQLAQRESALLRAANVVFAGGPSLYLAKRDRHDTVHCLPSSVDAAHFARGRSAVEAHPDVQRLPGPRLGFYGVIDERFDAGLVGEVASARPHWQFFIVGPVAKIDPATLPQRPNLHYLPQQSYALLPSLLAAWDICLLPFARNESTRFISPTKTLEYLAADKPVVGTRIDDVVALYGDVVRIADDAASFVAACEAFLDEPPRARDARVADSRALVERTSWDATAETMARAIGQAAASGLRAEAVALLSGAGEPPGAMPAAAAPRHAPCLILGAGPTGLSAAYHFGDGATLLEREKTVGGWCRSIHDGGFTFDCAGHIMFSNDPDVHALYEKLLGGNVAWQAREAWVYSKGTYTRYPFQGALYGLPPAVLKECIVGAIEARYGSLAADDCGEASAAHQDCCADGTDVPAAAGRRRAGARASEPRDFEAFIYQTWGSGIARHFAIPYNRKLWTYPLAEMETSWLGGRVPLPDLEQVIEGALSPVPKPMGPNARFGYPLRGGFQALMDGFLPHLRGTLELEADVVRVRPAAHEVELRDGRVYRYRTLVSTLPLPELVRRIGSEAPAEIHDAAARLRRVSVRCVNLGVGRENVSDKHWIYYPEDTIFHRVFLQGNASAHCNAPGGFALTCEISYSPVKPLPCEGQALIDRCVADCVRVGLLSPSDPIWTAHEVDMPYAYVLYDHARQASVDLIRNWLSARDILLAGRYSEWRYYNSDHAFIAGRDAARLAAARIEDAGPSRLRAGSATR